jgi:cytochrome c oxidase subunit 2
MIGSIVVQEPDEYERWLAGGAPGESMEQTGSKIFQSSGCATCHVNDGTGLGPSLLGVYGHPVKLTTGETANADDAYMRESIVLPKAKIVLGYTPIMPSFQGQMTEEQLTDVLAYLRVLGKAQPPAPKGEVKP